jgi:hypothetical protein
MDDYKKAFFRMHFFPVRQNKEKGTFLINLVVERLEEFSGPEQLRHSPRNAQSRWK